MQTVYQKVRYMLTHWVYCALPETGTFTFACSLRKVFGQQDGTTHCKMLGSICCTQVALHSLTLVSKGEHCHLSLPPVTTKTTVKTTVKICLTKSPLWTQMPVHKELVQKSGDEGGTKSSGTKSGLASTGTKSGLGSTCTKQTCRKRKRTSTVRRKPRKSTKPKPKPKQKPAPKTPKPRPDSPVPSTAHNTRSSLQPLLSVDNILDNKTRSAKPDKLSEKDPILDAFKELNDKMDMDILLSDDNKKRKSSCVGEEHLDTNDGVVKVKEYALKKPKKKSKTFHCASEGCQTTENTRKAMNKHEKDTHKDMAYSCDCCGATNFSSYDAMFKHTQRHFEFMHSCSVCSKKFQFPSQVEKHMSVHDMSKGFVCTWCGCKKVLANKDSLRQHVLRHQDLKLKCELCTEEKGEEAEHTFPTEMSLKQHQQGKHGNGYIAPCEAVKKWPTE